MSTAKCPHCQVVMRFPPEMGGKSVKCPKCQEVFRTPVASAPTGVAKPVAAKLAVAPLDVPESTFEFEEVPDAPAKSKRRKDDEDSDPVPKRKRSQVNDEDEDERPARRGQAPKKSNATLLLIVGLGAGLFVLLIAGGVAAYFLLGRKADVAQATTPTVQRPLAPEVSPQVQPTAKPAVLPSPTTKPKPVVLSGTDALLKGQFITPVQSQKPTTYAKMVSTSGDYIGQGRSYSYQAADLTARVNNGGVGFNLGGAGSFRVDVSAPKGQVLMVGEYPDAQRYPLNGSSPGLNISGQGRGSNKLTGKFVVWELELSGDKVVACAIDFIQYSEGKTESPLVGVVRFNSSCE